MDNLMDNHAGKQTIWLAGMIDADGSIGLHRQKYKNGSHYVPSVSLVTSCRKTRDYLISLFKDINVGFHVTERKPHNKNWSIVWVFESRGFKRVKCLLSIVDEYLVTKHEEASIVNQFITYREKVTPKEPYGDFEESCRTRLTYIKGNRNIV